MNNNVEEMAEENRIRILLDSNSDSFEMNLSNQNLYDIKLIDEELHTDARKYISSLNLSENHLMELKLSNIPTLLTLKANKNCLQSVILELKSLQVLDLTNNSLTAIPMLYKMTRLEQLYLAKNLISVFDAEMLPRNLVILDISDNLISVRNDEYPNFIRSFKKFLYLEQLSIDKNKFTLDYTNYSTNIAKQSLTLRIINHIELNLEEISSKPDDLATITSKRVVENIPKFDSLCTSVENARKYPPSCQVEIDNLMHYSQLLERMPPDSKLDQGYMDINRKRDFFEQIDMLHSSQPTYRTDICVILAHFCFVKDLSDGAMLRLVKFIKSSKVLSNEIQPIISDYIVKKLSIIEDVNDMPIGILNLLSRMAREVDISKPLSLLIKRFANYVSENKGTENSDIYRLIISVIAASVKFGTENVVILIKLIQSQQEDIEKESKKKADTRVHTFFTSLRKLISKPNSKLIEFNPDAKNSLDLYRYTLEIIMYCSLSNKDAASFFCKNLYSDFLSEIETSIADYETLKSETKENINIKYAVQVCETLALEIDTLSATLNAKSKELINKLLKDSKNYIITKALTFVTQSGIDPKILAAVCRLALMLFKNEEVLKNASVFSL